MYHGTSWERGLAALTLRVCHQAPVMLTCISRSSLVRCSRLFPQQPTAFPPAAMVAQPQALATVTLCPPTRAAWSMALDMAMAPQPPRLPPFPHPLRPLVAATSTCSPIKVSQVLSCPIRSQECANFY